MKKFLGLSALVFITTISAHAASEEYNCKGIQGSEGYSLYLRTSTPSAKEGEKFPIFVKVTNAANAIYTGYGRGTIEDVNLDFYSRGSDGKLSGHIFLDEYDQTSVSINGQEYRFNCAE